MSAYLVLTYDFTDRDTLIAALKAVGFNPVVHETPQPLRGYRGDLRKEKAEIIVPRQQLNGRYTGASNDLGFRWNEENGSYDVICSEYDSRFQLVERIAQAYVQNALEQLLESNHFTYEYAEDSAAVTDAKRGVVHLVARTMI